MWFQKRALMREIEQEFLSSDEYQRLENDRMTNYLRMSTADRYDFSYSSTSSISSTSESDDIDGDDEDDQFVLDRVGAIGLGKKKQQLSYYALDESLSSDEEDEDGFFLEPLPNLKRKQEQTHGSSSNQVADSLGRVVQYGEDEDSEFDSENEDEISEADVERLFLEEHSTAPVSFSNDLA